MIAKVRVGFGEHNNLTIVFLKRIFLTLAGIIFARTALILLLIYNPLIKVCILMMLFYYPETTTSHETATHLLNRPRLL